VNVGDLVCFQWHASFFDPNKTLGKDYGTDHIPVGLIIGFEPGVIYTSEAVPIVIETPIAKIVWQRWPGKSINWIEWNNQVKMESLSVIG
jgi:hypothetical protein